MKYTFMDSADNMKNEFLSDYRHRGDFEYDCFFSMAVQEKVRPDGGE